MRSLIKSVDMRNISLTSKGMLAAWLTLALSLSTTLFLWQHTKIDVMQNARQDFDFQVKEAEAAVHQRMVAYEQLLRGGVGLFAGSREVNDPDAVTRMEWRAYVKSLRIEESYPGIQGIGFSKRVLPEEKDAHVRNIRSEGFPSYTIWPEGIRTEYTSIIYLEPFDWRNQRAFGYDMFTEPVRREAMERARDTGKAAVSGMVKLVQETEKGVQMGFLMYLPVYRNGAHIDTIEERRSALVGYVYSPFRMNDLMNGVLGQEIRPIDLEIFDGNEITEKTLMYDDDSVKRFSLKKLVFTNKVKIDIGGHGWTLFFASTPSFESTIDKDRPFIVLTTGVFISLLFFAIVMSLATTRERAYGMANSMTSELQASEKRFRVLFEQAAVGVAEIETATGRFNRINKRYCEIVGYTEEEMKMITYREITHPDDLGKEVDKMKLLVTGKIHDFSLEKRYIRKDGGIVWVSLTVSPTWASGEDPQYHITVAQDITERKHAEEWSDKLTAIIENATDFIGLADPQGTPLYLNNAGRRMLGIGQDDEIWNIHTSDTHPDWANRILLEDGYPAAIREGVWIGETAFLSRDGREIPVSQMVIAHKGPDNEVQFFSTIARDITERKRAEETLRESEERYRLLFNGTSDAIFVYKVTPQWDLGKVIEVNDLACRMLGYTREEMLGLTARDINSPETFDVASAMERLLEGKEVLIERIYVTKDGKKIPVEINSHLIELKGKHILLAIVRDLTERKKSEALQLQMLSAQKLESLGVLAGGIAHDFNNLLMTIMGNTEMALNELPETSPARRYVEKSEEVAKRASEIAKQMLAYSGKGKFVIENIDLSELVENTGELLRVSIRKNVTIAYNLARNLPQVEGDATQIRQVVMNLIINASDAIGENHGNINVSTGAAECDSECLSKMDIGKDRPAGTYVYIEVSDNGCGMDDETRSKIFEPFFTTKFTGRGLGLAAVLGIVRGHKGALKIYSKVGEGTTFRVLFPKSEHRIEPSPVQKIKPGIWQGKGTVLLVEDEEDVSSITRTMLEGLGFSVLTAKDGQEGVELFRDHAAEITAVLMDMTMPKMSGEEAFREMKVIRGDVKVILTSGYNEEEISGRFYGEGFAGFLHKPYSFQDLMIKVREVLE